MEPVFNDLLFSSLKQVAGKRFLRLHPTYFQQTSWWQIQLDESWMQRIGTLAYGQYLCDCYLLAHPAEQQRVGETLILTTILRSLDLPPCP